MMKKSLLFLSVLFLLLADSTAGQTSYDHLRSQLIERQQSTRSQIENLDRQIETITGQLDEVTQEYDEVYRRFEELNRLISLQRERLRQMNREQNQIAEEIDLIERNLRNLEQQLQELVDQYKETLTYLYKHGRTTELALLLTSTSINQLMIRSYYLAQFNNHLQSQVDEIEQTQAQLEQSKRDLETTRVRNEESLASIRREAANLENQQQQQQRVVETLQGDISSLEQRRNQSRQQRENLQSTMENLLREQERLRRAEASGAEIVRREVAVSEEEINQFENRFREQRGQLPWPVENGTITERFGERVHPVYATRTQNLGIDISTLPRSSVHVVSDGYVYGIQNLTGYGEVVFVNHGGYNSAYGNLSDIFVRRNQVLRKGDVIGLSGDSNSIRGPVLFFLIGEGSRMVNPEPWLQRPQP